MEFKRLNNMTGKDPILNRRIASIFLTEFENFLQLLKGLPQEPNADNLRFSLHKLRPSLVIFEMDKLIKTFDQIAERKSNGDVISENDIQLASAIDEGHQQIEGVRLFLEQL